MKINTMVKKNQELDPRFQDPYAVSINGLVILDTSGKLGTYMLPPRRDILNVKLHRLNALLHFYTSFNILKSITKMN